MANIKNHLTEKPKLKIQKPEDLDEDNFLHFKQNTSFEKTRKKKIKKWQKEKHEKKEVNFDILITKINTTNIYIIKSLKKDIFRVVYYNCNKKSSNFQN